MMMVSNLIGRLEGAVLVCKECWGRCGMIRYRQQLDGVLSSVETQKRQFEDNFMNLMERFG